MIPAGHLVWVVLSLLLHGQVQHAHAWVNSYDQPFTFSCNHSQFLSDVSSQHSNGAEDRQFDFRCRNLPGEGQSVSCYWSAYANNFDEPVVFLCPDDGFVAGIYSYHENGPEDRRFKFDCCHLSGYVTHDCLYSGWVNDFDGAFIYSVPNDHVLKGMISIHNNGPEDRRFQFQVCRLKNTV